MNPRLLHHYNNELAHLRQAGAEFARQFPKIAGRLALDPDGQDACPDPFVERLLEGVAFLTARVQLKFEAEFPRLTQSLLETVYPHYLAPTPSMLVARFEPELNEPALATGFTVPRGTTLRGELARGVSTPCEYRTAHEVTLWPLRLIEAAYRTRDLAQLHLPGHVKATSALVFKFALTAGVKTKALQLDTLPIHLRGTGELPYRIYEDIYSRLQSVVLQTGSGTSRKSAVLGADAIRQVGFTRDEALLPSTPRSFEGYRLLAEYFNFPQRFLFFEVQRMREALQQRNEDTFDLVLTFDEVDTFLENRVDSSAFELFCTPAINLFPKQVDRIQLEDRFSEYHIVADKTRPLDYEIHTVTRVAGIGETQDDSQTFTPFYFSHDRDFTAQAYYALHRVHRTLSERERQFGAASKYLGSETLLSLVDANCAPHRPELQQLSLSALCTNRHLALQMPIGVGRTDFNLDVNAPVVSTRCITGPTAPMPSIIEGELSWRIISHLSLNYLSISEGSEEDRAAALREILALYANRSDESQRRQLQTLKRVSSSPILRRVQTPGPIGFARGLEISLEFQEGEFSGVGLFLFGAVLERFLSKCVSINSFTETVLRSERGEIKRWPAQPGRRCVL